MKDATFVPGARCGGYVLLSRLGHGGVADVHKAVHTVTGRVVALKILHTCHASNVYIKEHMLAEAELLSSLNHANVVRVEDVGSEKGTLWMAMEFLPGVTLRALLQRCGRIEVTTALYFAREIADGVAAAHEMQVIHRDLKPENIMITEDNRVKVLDMGAGKFYGWDIRGTQTGTIMGTPLYMSPEHIRADPVDVRADVYSLGLILYEMLVGVHPFANGSESPLAKYEVCERQLHVDPPPLTSIVESIPKDVSDLVQRALAKDKAMRPSSMREFAKSVRELLKKSLLEAPALRSFPLIEAAETALAHEQRSPNEPSGAATSNSPAEEPARVEGEPNRALPTAELHAGSGAMETEDEDEDEDEETLVMSREDVLSSAENSPQYTEHHTEIMYSSRAHDHEAQGTSAGALPSDSKAAARPIGFRAKQDASPPPSSPAMPVVRTDLWPPAGPTEAAAAFVSLRRSRRVDRTLRMLLGSACIALGLSFTYSMALDPPRARVDMPDAMIELALAASSVDTEQLAGAETAAPQPRAREEAPARPTPRQRPSQSAPAPRKTAEMPACSGGPCGDGAPVKEASKKAPPIEMMAAPFPERERPQKGAASSPGKPSGGDKKAKGATPKPQYRHMPGAI